MHPQALRSARGRLALDANRTSESLKACIRQFSTTQLRPQSENSTSDAFKPTGVEKSRAAVNEIGKLRQDSPIRRVDENLASGIPGGDGSTANVVNIHRVSSNNARGFGRQSGLAPGSRLQAAGETTGFGSRKPDGARIARLPSSFRGRFQGGRTPGLQRGPGFRPSGLSEPSGSGQPRGKFASRGGRGGRGGRGRTRGPRNDESEIMNAPKERVNEYDRFLRPDTQAEHLFIEERDRGLPQPFNPSVTIESLTGYGPPIATDSSELGKVETVMQNLRALGEAHGFEPQPWKLARHSAFVLKERDMIFFGDLAERTHVEEYLKDLKARKVEEDKNSDISAEEKEWRKRDPYSEDYVADVQLVGPTDAVKTTILEKAVKGYYEAPKFSASNDQVGLSRSAHIRNETYLPRDVKSFEDKLVTLLPEARKAGKTTAQAGNSA